MGVVLGAMPAGAAAVVLDQPEPTSASEDPGERNGAAAPSLVVVAESRRDGCPVAEPAQRSELRPSIGPNGPDDHSWAVARGQAGASKGSLRVLVADDAPDLREMLALLLATHLGFELAGQAGDGWEAVRLAGQHQPDVVLLDIAMPGMDGMEAIPVIREISPGTRIVVFSGYSAAQRQAEVLRLGADAYLEKSTPFGALFAKLTALCGTAGTARPVTADNGAERCSR